jgi:hypothetical protein
MGWRVSVYFLNSLLKVAACVLSVCAAQANSYAESGEVYHQGGGGNKYGGGYSGPVRTGAQPGRQASYGSLLAKEDEFIDPSVQVEVAKDELGHYKKMCGQIGFAERTEAFGECVLELRKRDVSTEERIASPNSAEPIGDGTPDDATCAGYGFRVGTTEYAACRQQIDVARSQAEQLQQQYELAHLQYEEQKRQYDAQVAAAAAAEKEKERQGSLKMMEFWLAVAGSPSPTFGGALADAGRQSLGLPALTAPQPPAPPAIERFRITWPNNQTSYCRFSPDLESIRCN